MLSIIILLIALMFVGNDDNNSSSSRAENQGEETQERNYTTEIPIGFKFKPTDVEIVCDYLVKKATSRTVPPSEIHDLTPCDFYETNPKHLVLNYPDQREWYFYIPQNASEFKEKIREVVRGVGHWQQQPHSDVLIRDRENNPIANKSLFKFFRWIPEDKLTEDTKKVITATYWKMELYELLDQNTGWVMVKLMKATQYDGL